MDIKIYTSAEAITAMLGGEAAAHLAPAAMTDGTYLSTLSASLGAISTSVADLFESLELQPESEDQDRYCTAVKQYATCKLALLILPEVVAEEPDAARLEHSLEGTLADLGVRVAQLFTAITNLPAQAPAAPVVEPAAAMVAEPEPAVGNIVLSGTIVADQINQGELHHDPEA
jgi:hypothetical protein